jgi:hypothetical protein
MLRSVFITSIQQTCGIFLARTLCSLALVTAISQNLDALPSVVLESPDIIEIAVQHLPEVQAQLSNGLGISWGPTTTESTHVIINGTPQHVLLTRTYSVSSFPYIELIQSDPQIGPWAAFNDAVVGECPRASMVWRVSAGDFPKAISQMTDAGLTNTARGSNFAYFEAVNGVQLEIILNSASPDPAAGVPNTPPLGSFDFGPMKQFAIVQRPGPLSLAATQTISRDDFDLRHAISNATGQGITWDLNVPVMSYFPWIVAGQPGFAFISNPSLVFSCNRQTNSPQQPTITTAQLLPAVIPFAATSNSNNFSFAWLPIGSNLSPEGAAIMQAWEGQLVSAGFEPVIRVDAQSVGITPYSVDIISYFRGIDNILIQFGNAAFDNIACTCSCIGSGGD